MPRRRRSMWKKSPIRPAAWCASASGTATAGAFAATRSATKRSLGRDLTALDFRSPAETTAGFFLAGYVKLSRRAHRLQHRLARPAIDLDPGRLLIGAECGTRQHAGLAIDLVLVDADPRQMLLHRFHGFRTQLRRRRPWRRKGLRVGHAVGEMADE